MGPNILELSKFCCFICCFSAVLYLTVKDLKRYLDNDDTTVIEFKRFNASPDDKYPVITLCFHGKYGTHAFIYKEEALNRSGLSVTQYWNMITGNSNATAVEIQSLPDFSSVTTKLEDLTQTFSTTDRNSQGVNMMIKNSKELFPKFHDPSQNTTLIPFPTIPDSYWPFYLSYQNPDQVCYSQLSEFKHHFIKSNDYIRIDTGLLDYFEKGGYLDVYLHYAGQILRSFVKEVISIKLLEDGPNKSIQITVSGFSVIKRRLDANDPCNPNFEEEDIHYRNYIAAKIGCIPPYWINLQVILPGLKPCTSALQLKEGYRYSQYGSVGKILDLQPLPCSEMTMISSIDRMNGSFLELGFMYRNDKYWEIRNTRDFGMASLWSSTGGFVGVFLGFSLFQFIEILLNRTFSLVNDKNLI